MIGVPDEREALRSRLFLRAVVPLLEVVFAEVPSLSRPFRGVDADVQIEVKGENLGACLRFGSGLLRVEQCLREDARIAFRFADRARLNAFFAGRFALPSVDGFRHPFLLLRVARLLGALQIMNPKTRAATPEKRNLRARLLIYLISRALAEMFHGGLPGMVDLVADSPERVFQWTIVREGIGSWLRVERGRVRAGRGTYLARQPFVHWVFPDVDAALDVLTATGNQVEGLRAGKVQTLGSPEYTRKVTLLMQKVDELMIEG
jgi:hypothetical protein